MAAFRRVLFGYRRREVDAELDELRRQLQVARVGADLGATVGRHLGSLLTRFADAVEEGEREAHAAAAKVLADAEARAAAIEAEAARRFGMATAAKDAARTRVEEALGQLTATMAALDAVPDDVPSVGLVA